jgi:Mlc titration factor MtfA (ptsG expression regulator)
MAGFFKSHRRAALLREPLSPSERAVVQRNVPFAAKLNDADRKELEGLIRVFLAEKSFEGCGGLELTEEIRVTIAAEACLLLLHRETDFYPNVDAILVYPGAFRAPGVHKVGDVVVEGPEARVGESWTKGLVVLAWDRVKPSGTHPDGHSVVFHEFAHQLDSEDGLMNGSPDLGSRTRYASWGRVLGEEFDELSQRLHDGRPTDIDTYGATSPAEFFAVVTEMFFESPRALKERHPALYGELSTFYAQDPADAP